MAFLTRAVAVVRAELARILLAAEEADREGRQAAAAWLRGQAGRLVLAVNRLRAAALRVAESRAA